MNMFKNRRFFSVSVLGILALVFTTAGSRMPHHAQAALASSDISISITADRTTVRSGQHVTYTVTMTNRGPDDAAFVDTGFQIPARLRLVSMTCDQGISPDTPFCEYSSLPAGATMVSTLVAAPVVGSRRGAAIVTTSASVFFENVDASDPNMANNTAAVKTRIIGRP